MLYSPFTCAGVENAERSASTGGIPMAGLEILVVEDCPDTAASTALLLRHYGHQVRIAADGPTALARVQEDHPDVVLLDIALPGMNGYKVARHIREHFFDKPPLIVAVTGFGQEADRQRAEQAGIDMHLVKPVDPFALTALLSRFARVVGCSS